MDYPDELISHLATEEDWKVARALLDDKHFRLSLAIREATRAGIRLNASHVAKVLEINDKTAREWLEELARPRQ